jgi:hypothetical protein
MESLATSSVLTEGPMRPSLVPSRKVTGHSRGWSTPAAALSPVKLAAALGLDLKELGQVYSAECVYSRRGEIFAVLVLLQIYLSNMLSSCRLNNVLWHGRISVPPY